MKRSTLGNQELLLLTYLADHTPITVSEAAESFGKDHGLARTTILTMMERLRHKGRLTREQVKGINQYNLSESKSDLQRGLVSDFFQRAMGGALEPFVSYLTHDAELTEQEIEALHTMVEHLDARRKG
jgi:predicted transcriptional regulator